MKNSKPKLVGRQVIEIKVAVAAELPAIQELYREFTGDNMKEIIEFNREKTTESIRGMIDRGEVMLVLAEGRPIGFLSGQFIECHFSNDLMFMAMFFYVALKYRRYAQGVLKTVEEVLKHHALKPTMFVVASPAFKNSEKLDRWFEINGFTLLEKHYWKAIPHAG